MKPGRSNNDPAFPVMAMDILSNVLSRADNPGDLGTYLTEEIRDLTGARCVLLSQFLGTATITAHRVVSVNPLRRRDWAESPAVNRLYEVVYRMPATQFWHGDEPSEVAGLLRREGFELSMAFPLNAGAFRVGAMLVLGLPDEEHISSVLDLLNNLSAIVALVLRNSFLFERQEEIIQERTAELSASEEKYRTLIESANDAVFIHEIGEDGRPGQFIEVNELACRQLGYSREELARLTPMELDDPRYRDRIALAMERLLKDGHAVFETAQISKDGRSIPVEVSTRVLELKGTRLLFSIVRDITERKRAEEALKESEAKYMDLYENAPDMYASVNARTALIEQCNNTLCGVLGYSKGEIIGRPVFEIYHPDCLEEVQKAFTLFRDTGEVRDKELQVRRKDGSRLDVSLNVSSVHDKDGSILYSRSTLRDITESKRNHAINASRLHLLQFAATHSLDDLLEETLNEAEKLTGSVIGFYHFVDDDQESLTLQNWSARTKAEFCKAEGKGLHYAIAIAGVWVDCVHQRTAVIHNDYASLPHRKGMPEGHAAVIRELVVPVSRGPKLKAIIGVGNKPSDYNEKDVQAISLLADLAWEIAERKRADETLHRLNRELRAISNCNQVLMQAVDEQTLLDDICRIICDEAGYRMAWVGYADNDEAKSVRPVAWAGVEDGYLATAGITWAETERGRGPTGTAVRSGKSTLIKDFTTDPKATPWRDGALQRGYRSSIAIPLKDESGNTFGALTIYSTEPDTFNTPDEVRLLEELTDDLAFGITVLRTRDARKEAERSIALLSFALNNVHEAAFLIDESARFRYVNEESCRALEYTCEELLGLGVADVDPDFPMERWAGHWDKLKTRGSLTFEGRHKAKDGNIFPVEIYANYFEYGGEGYNLALARDITERKRAEEERLAHLRFLESMDRVNRATQSTTDLEQMMSDVLNVVLSIFECDRTFLMYPCDPEAAAWQVPMERTRPEYPGALALGLDMSMDEEVAETLRILLSSDGPVKFGPGTGHPLPTDVSERLRFKSFMSTALYPRVGKPWQFGIHQCSYPRVWTLEEERLLQEIGRRLEDGLTSLLAYRDLRESEGRYRRIVDTATEGIWMVGPDSMTTFVNARMAELLGCSGEEMIGRPLTDFMFVEDAPDHLRKMENRRQGTSGYYERRFRRQDGQTVWTHVSATPIFDAEHNFLGSFAMFTDITERKQAVEELREKTEELDRYFTTALDLLCIADTDGHFIRLNPEWEPTLGFSVSELEGRRFLDFVHPDDRESTLHALSQLAEQKAVLNFINRYRCKNGSYRWIDWRSYPSGTRIYAVARDITERKEAEEEIRRLKNYLANIIDSMPSVLVGMDRNEIVTQWNRQAEEISGIPATEAVGRPITDLLPDFSPWIEAMRSEIEQQRPASMEKLLIEKEGECRFYDLMLYPIIANGAEGAVIRIEDATERARIQELMVQTEKMMSVGGLAAGMAHEINNPLGIITQAAQNIERRVSPELPANRKAAEELGVSLEGINAYFEKRQIPEFISSIRTAGFRAARIVANMLQFSRYSGTTMQPVSPAEIIEQALELAASDYDLKKKFDFRSIEIIRDYDSDVTEVPMVAVEIEQVMLNLLKNAAQAMTLNLPNQRPRISLRLRREERYALIEVEDNGPGMKEEVRRRAFEPFFTTKEPGMGTGLGLSVSYMIVTQNHKGLMEVESKPGKGSCFRVRLPLSKESIHG